VTIDGVRIGEWIYCPLIHTTLLSEVVGLETAQISDKKKWRYACRLFGTNSLKEGAIWRIDPFLGKDLETKETTAVAMQRCGKHASTTTELLLETVFSTRSVQRGYKEDNWVDPVIPVWRRGRIPPP
jgi:hypothetical protein